MNDHLKTSQVHGFGRGRREIVIIQFFFSFLTYHRKYVSYKQKNQSLFKVKASWVLLTITKTTSLRSSYDKHPDDNHDICDNNNITHSSPFFFFFKSLFVALHDSGFFAFRLIIIVSHIPWGYSGNENTLILQEIKRVATYFTYSSSVENMKL